MVMEIRAEYQGNATTTEEGKVMADDTINQIMQIAEIKGVLQTNAMGDDIVSNIKDEQLGHFIKYLVGFAPLFEKTAELGSISSIVLCNNKDNHIGVFIGKEHSLGLLFDRSCSIKKLHSQIAKHLKDMSIGDR